MRRAGGFTLIEVMMAVAILGLAAVTLLLVCSTAVERGADANHMRTLRLLANEKLHELRLADPKSQNRSSGSFPEPYTGYKYDYATETEDWDTPKNDGTLPDATGKKIALTKGKLTVYGPDGQMKLELVDYLFPEASEPPETKEEQPK